MFEFAEEVRVRGGSFGSGGGRGGRCGGDVGNNFFRKWDVIVRERRVDEQEAPDLDPAGEKLAHGFVGDNTTERPAWCTCQYLDVLDWREGSGVEGFYIPPSMSDEVSDGERDEM